MEKKVIKIIDKSKLHESDSYKKIAVPKWFLDKISEAETTREVRKIIEEMKLSVKNHLCSRKSINLAEVRIRIIEHEKSKKRIKK